MRGPERGRKGLGSSAAGGAGEDARSWPLPAALLLFWLILALLFVLSLRACEGRQVYALDDAYIHLELARNLTLHGSWGLEPGVFAGVSSSLFWPLLLAPAFLFPDYSHLAPLLLNIIFASLLLAFFDRGLRGAGASAPRRYMALLVLIFLAPLPSLVFSGMEHLLQALLALLLLNLVVEDLRREDERPLLIIRGVTLALCACLLTATRFEGLFLTLPLALLFLIRGRPWRALELAAASMLPLVVYGFGSHLQGALWLPNSIAVKGKGLDLSASGAWLDSVSTPLRAHLSHPQSPFIVHVLILIPLLLLLVPLWGGGRGAEAGAVVSPQAERLARGRLVALPLALALIAQLVFAGVGWFFRYETWLLVAALFVLLAWLPGARWRPAFSGRPVGQGLILLLLILLGGSLLLRGVVAMGRIVPAMRNIYEQPVQASLFLQKHYPDRAAIVGDLGAASFLSGGVRLDLMGLSHADVAVARRVGTLDAAMVDSLAGALNAPVALLHERVFGGLLPTDWVKAGDWIVGHNVVLGGDTLSFYSTGSGDAEVLRAHLIEQADALPAGVETRFYP